MLSAVNSSTPADGDTSQDLLSACLTAIRLSWTQAIWAVSAVLLAGLFITSWQVLGSTLLLVIIYYLKLAGGMLGRHLLP